jgi:hypothetical protein
MFAGEHREQDGDQPANNVGIAVARKGEHRFVGGGMDHGREPNLAGAALDLVCLDAVAFGQRVEQAAQLDHITVTIIPLVQQGKVLDDLVDRRQ